MKAIALAAGLGTRLGSITRQLPKCMVEVGDKPVLQRNLEWAASQGVTEVAVNLHYCPEAVVEHFTATEPPLPIHWSYEPELLGTAGTVRSLCDWVGAEPFVVMYADNLTTCDLAAMRALHVRRQATATVALFHREDVTASGVAEVTFRDRITRFVEKPRSEQTVSHWVNAGLIIFEASVAQRASAHGDIGHDLLPALLADRLSVVGYRMSESETHHWIDTPFDLEHTRSIFAEALR